MHAGYPYTVFELARMLTHFLATVHQLHNARLMKVGHCFHSNVSEENNLGIVRKIVSMCQWANVSICHVSMCRVSKCQWANVSCADRQM